MESRRFIRHPSDIPIEYSLSENQTSKEIPLADVSKGGLSFHVEECLPIGQQLSLCIPSIRPDLQIDAVVTWCDANQDGYQVGIRFLNEEDKFTIRMVEQVCYIEAYRKKVLDREGRELSATEAAQEWIARYAEEFPST